MTKNTTIICDNFFEYQSALDTLTAKGLDNCIISTNNVFFSIEIILTAAESKLPNLTKSISKLKQQLVNELLSKRYAESGIKQLLADRLSNLIQSILGDLHERL